jgi:hypothetical protein
MSMLDKQLARFAQECHRLNADHWRLALTNGNCLTVSARRGEGFLMLDADTGISPAAKSLIPLAQRSCELPAAVKLALPRGSSRVRLRSEFPLPEESEAAAERIREHLEGMRGAFHRIDEAAAVEEMLCPEPAGDGQAIPGSLTELLHEAGWQHHERTGGALLADLETGSRYLQAEIEPCGAGARFRLTLYRDDAGSEAAREALCLYLLDANAALRYARGFLKPEGDGISAGFEVCMKSMPSAAEAGHALGALSVAGRQCAAEIDVLMKDGSLAGMYRSTLPILDYESKSKGA